MPRRRPRSSPQRPAVRDPRGSAFADEATTLLQQLGFPCVVGNGGGGLGVFASRHISAGTKILEERPLVLTVAHSARMHTCCMCLCDSRTVGLDAWERRCESCDMQYYCNEHCALAASVRHCGVECTALSGVDWAAIDEDDRDAVVQAIRILADRANGVLHDIGPAGTLGADAYQHRLVGITPSTATARDSLDRICAATLRAVPPAARVAPTELLDILERHSCNLYGVSGQAGAEVASASFVGFFHLFNHSCCPSVVFDSARPVEAAHISSVNGTPRGEVGEVGKEVGDDGVSNSRSEKGTLTNSASNNLQTSRPPTFALLALEDVPEGTELCISYTSSAEGPAQRREHLEEYYGFWCECARCTCDDVAAELDFCDRMDARRCCLDSCGSGLGVPLGEDDGSDGQGESLLRCVHCGGLFEADTEG